MIRPIPLARALLSVMGGDYWLGHDWLTYPVTTFSAAWAFTNQARQPLHRNHLTHSDGVT